jgi:acetyltransferase
MAIHPYPTHLVSQWQLPNGMDATIRPIRPEDAEITQSFVRGLSEEAKYFRFMDAVRELSPGMLARLTQIDYDREMALLMVTQVDGQDVEMGVARYATGVSPSVAEFALVVDERWQHQGIGHKLMNVLMDVARGKGVKVFEGEVLKSNHKMLHLVEGLGFRTETHPDDDSIKYVVRNL